MKYIHFLVRSSFIFLEVFIAFFAAVIVISLFGTAWSSSVEYTPKEAGITIYLRTDGTHTDFVLPVHNQQWDWSKKMPNEYVSTPDTTRNWVSFGWGNKNFFIKTKEWKDLTIGTALKAAFYIGESAIHNVYHYQPEKAENVKELIISSEQYITLCNYIQKSYVLTKNNQYSVIPNAGYWENDVFYNAFGKYGVFYTCNTWVNDGLKAAQLPACLFTPFARGIMCNYSMVN